MICLWTQETGFLEAQIKISGLDCQLWHSEIFSLQVKRSIPIDTEQAISFASARIANPEIEPAITVTERTMQIPKELQNIAVQSDQNSETVTIKAPRYFDGHDLSRYQFWLRTVNSDGGYDPVSLNPVVEGHEISMLWTLRPPQTSIPGRLSIQLWVTGVSFDWHTAPTSVNIINRIGGEPVIPVNPPFWDEFLKKVSAFAEKAQISEANAAESASQAQDAAEQSEESKRNALESAKSAREDALKAETARRETEALKDQAQAIKDSTAVLVQIDSSEETGYRVGFQRADEQEAKFTPALQARVNAGVVTMLEPGDLPTVTQEGPPNNRTFSFGIPRGERGEPGKDGVNISISGMFTLSGDEDGNLWAYYADGDTPPEFETDENGNIYYITPDS